MEIILDLNKKGNYDTDLYNILNNISDDILFNNEHKLRKPITIYKRSQERVIKSFENLLDELNNVYHKKLNDFKWDDVDNAHTELLDSIMAFTDDGFNILKCFFQSQKKDEVQ